jgi:hypothetical protein
MFIVNRKIKVAISFCAILGVSGIAFAGPTKAAMEFHKTVKELLPIYNKCSAEFNSRTSAAATDCNGALKVSSDAREKYNIIKSSEVKNTDIKQINASLVGMENSLKGISSGLKNKTVQTTQLAEGSDGSLSVDEPIFNTVIVSKYYETTVVQFYPETFDEAEISTELENIRTSSSFPRIRLDAFSAGNVLSGMEQENAAICGQWIEWLLRKNGENPLSIMSSGYGYITDWDQDFQIYFPREFGSTTEYPAYCIVGVIVTDAHDVWSSEDFGSWHVYMQPVGEWPEAEIAELTQIMTADFGILSMEIAGHADGPDTSEKVNEYSMQCAQSVVDALVRNGVDPIRLEVVANGRSKISYGSATAIESPWACMVSANTLKLL